MPWNWLFIFFVSSVNGVTRTIWLLNGLWNFNPSAGSGFQGHGGVSFTLQVAALHLGL